MDSDDWPALMMSKGRAISVCVCGGGNIGHVVATALGANPALRVTVLTRRPTKWKSITEISYRGSVLLGRIAKASASPDQVVKDANVVLVTAPAFAWKSIITKIAPFLTPQTWVGAICGTHGFDWQIEAQAGARAKIFGLQRAPYVSRVTRYGHRVSLSGIRREVYLGALPRAECAIPMRFLSRFLHLRVKPVRSYLAITLTPGNTAFHSARLFALFGRTPARATDARMPLFYADWDDTASFWYMTLDDEIQAICAALPIDLSEVASIRSHYGVRTIRELTSRIRSLPALQKIPVPARRVARGWRVDVSHRFFREDVVDGLSTLRGIAELAGVETPAVDLMLRWAGQQIGDRSAESNRLWFLTHPEIACPQHFGIHEVATLLARAAR